MPTASAFLATDRPARYIKQLVSHLSNRIDAEQVDEHHGVVRMGDAGTCELTAKEDGIGLAARALEEREMNQVQEVVTSHLLRFTGEPRLTRDWVED